MDHGLSKPPPEHRAPIERDGLIGLVVAERYRIESRVGAGGFGIVYRAFDQEAQHHVAVKVLREEFYGRKIQRGRFDREARALLPLRHPHIVTVTDFGVARDMPFLVMELLEGHSLDRELRLHGALAIPRSFTLMQQLLAGLGYIHAHDLVHRDIKPANIFLHRAPNGVEQLKLLDFGLAKFVTGKSEDPCTLTRDGDVFGTPGYMPPEQLASEEVDQRADLYSAAVVFYEMLAGRRPFTGPAHEVLRMVLVDPPPPLRSLCPNRIPHPELSRVLTRALAKRPEERFFDAAALSHALRTVPEPALVDLTQRLLPPRQDPFASETSLTTAEFAPAPVPASLPPAPPTMESAVRPAHPAGRFALNTILLLVATGVAAMGVYAAVLHTWSNYGEGSIEVAAGTDDRAAGSASLEHDIAAAELADRRVSTTRHQRGADVSGNRAAADAAGRTPRPHTASVEQVKAVSADGAPALPDPWMKPAPRWLHGLRVRILRGAKGDRDTLRQLQNYNRDRPQDGRGHLLLGHLHLNRNRPALALRHYRAALKRDPSSRGDRNLFHDLMWLSDGPQGHKARQLLRATYGDDAMQTWARANR